MAKTTVRAGESWDDIALRTLGDLNKTAAATIAGSNATSDKGAPVEGTTVEVNGWDQIDRTPEKAKTPPAPPPSPTTTPPTAPTTGQGGSTGYAGPERRVATSPRRVTNIGHFVITAGVSTLGADRRTGAADRRA